MMINYEPAWEAASKMIDLLVDAFGGTFGAEVVGFNLRGHRFRREGVRRWFPAPLLLAPKVAFERVVGRYEITHLLSSGKERYMISYLDGQQVVLSIAKGTSTEDIQRNVHRFRHVRYLLVESEHHRERLLDGGMTDERVKLIYPAAAVRPYVPPPLGEPFTILFATSPFKRNTLVERGMQLLVDAARILPDVRFILVWRKHNHGALQRMVRSAGVSNVEVRNGYIRDMNALYDAAHATIVPGLRTDSVKPCPHSLLDSMAHGKPVLVSKPTQVSGVIGRSGSGVVFEPTTEALREAIIHLRDNYGAYQANCHSTVASTFSPAVFIERHRRVYESILGG